ncbi:MAG: transposase [Myxococcota bacterium]
MANKKCRNHSNKQKAELLRSHLMDKVPVSDLCDEHSIQPSVFYGWQRQLMDNLVMALEATSTNHRNKQATREKELLEQLEAAQSRLARKDQVIAQLSEEYVTLKK